MSNLVEILEAVAKGGASDSRPLTTATDAALAEAEMELQDEHNGWLAAADEARDQLVRAENTGEMYASLLFRVRREQQIREMRKR